MHKKNGVQVASFLLFITALSGCIDDKSAPVSDVPPQTVSVSISPASTTLPTGGTQTFSAAVTGSGNTAVSWKIQEGASGGSITSKGEYTAPGTTGTFHVIATSQKDETKTATATITISSILDNTFGTNGKTTTTFGGIDQIKALAVQGDGKIIAGGTSLRGPFSDFALARYNTDGSLDTSFGENGVTTTSFGTHAKINALAIQSDGKIIAGGDTGDNENGVFALARYDTEGKLDLTFGPSSTGFLTTTPGTQDNRLNTLKLQGNNIIVAGSSFLPITGTVNGGRYVFTLIRFNQNGILDTTFGTSGMVQTLVKNSGATGSNGNSEIMALAIQSTGEIVAGGRFSLSGDRFAIARYDRNGTLDTSFDGDGINLTNIGGSQQINALLIQPTGEIVAGGFSSSRFALARYATNGSLDTAFSGDGVLTTTVGSGGNAQVFGLIFVNNGIIAGGLGFNGTNNSNFALARYDLSGALDGTFGSGGILTTQLSTGADGIRALMLDDNNIIAGGFALNGNRTDFALARYGTNGVLDTTFDADGIVTTAIGGGDDEINAIALQTDNKIIAAGFTVDANNKTRDFAVARYDTDGTLDPAFGTGGKVTTSISSNNTTPGHDVINAVLIQPDGKIVAGGSSYKTEFPPILDHTDFTLIRYNADGSVDTTGFGFSGIATTTINNRDDEINAIALQSDGKIIAAGTSFTVGTTTNHHDFTLTRYETNGSLDTTFGSSGITITPILNGAFAEAVALQSDGKIVVAGSSESNSGFDFSVARYNSDGTLDITFDGDGIVTTAVSTGHDFGKTLKIMDDGKILVSGTTFIGGAPEQFAIVRYQSDGSLDATFGSNGIVTTPINNGAQSLALAIQPLDGKIVLGGFSITAFNSRDFTLARYLTDGALDTSFGQNGIETSPFSTEMDEIHDLLILSGGQILAAGFSTNLQGMNADFHLARYAP